MELIPEPLWGRNVRNNPRLWDKLRFPAYRATNYHCQICDWASETVLELESKFIARFVTTSEHSLEAHEIWEYEIDHRAKSGIQRLVGIVALCELCHRVKHWDAPMFPDAEVEMERLKRLKKHCLEVNGWTEADFAEHEAAARAELAYRNTLKWTQDLSLVL
jgi:hypothetical protein